jgi:hypothetical protein
VDLRHASAAVLWHDRDATATDAEIKEERGHRMSGFVVCGGGWLVSSHLLLLSM